ncbi:nicotinate phosphoribosyltransferase [Methylomarinovum caldicuralii]|uniref:Nicotinate phosphoribosyltransferase n=1 Tax=Methylomarinovum caldicuralii TaxID=438856 RepID=A0AAU9BU89_9GAMM|nr:nicotinate phosphoribosyltransferase [Methylomarinovum caldicuralii]BCX82226.1 nicotinate phosphoribosyltransferase [Methylomarinovum caldicuralii]
MNASVLLTDLYQLTMLQGYWHEGMAETAVFELFVRKLPPGRNFLVAAGLEQALDYLENLRFTAAELDYLQRTGFFDDGFLATLENFRFEGDVDAMPEGTVFFPDEPILRVTAPLPQAQLVETRLINLLQFQTLIASKAVRCVLAAPGKRLVDFGLRRAHGSEAGLLAARAAYLAGFIGTSNVLAGRRFDIPVFGTMAHSYIMAHDDELAAFRGFARSQPHNVVLLIDTYDTLKAVDKVVALARELAEDGIRIKAVRIDSGDLGGLARQVRARLDAAGWSEIGIFASGDLDEYRLAELRDAPIDGFGVGTRLTTASDAPYLNCAYKLQEYAGIPRRKVSKGKQTWPGAKQVFRHYDPAGRFDHDVLTTADDHLEGQALLQPVMRQGKRLQPQESLTGIRDRIAAQLQRLPEALKNLDGAAEYPVEIAPALWRLTEETDRRLGLA